MNIRRKHAQCTKPHSSWRTRGGANAMRAQWEAHTTGRTMGSQVESVEHGESESEMNDIHEDDALAIDCEDLTSLLGEEFVLSDG